MKSKTGMVRVSQETLVRLQAFKDCLSRQYYLGQLTLPEDQVNGVTADYALNVLLDRVEGHVERAGPEAQEEGRKGGRLAPLGRAGRGGRVAPGLTVFTSATRVVSFFRRRETRWVPEKSPWVRQASCAGHASSSVARRAEQVALFFPR